MWIYSRNTKKLLAVSAGAWWLLYLGYSNTVHYYAAIGDVQAIKQAYAKGYALSEKNIAGFTPIIVAAWFNQQKSVETLLTLGAHDAGGDITHKPLSYYVLRYMNTDACLQSRVKALRDIVVLDKAVSHVKPLNIGDFPSYNGSLVVDKRDYVFANRTDVTQQWYQKPTSMVSLVRLDNNFSAKKTPSVLLCQDCEDARVFVQQNNKTWLFFNANETMGYASTARSRLRKMFFSAVCSTPEGGWRFGDKVQMQVIQGAEQIWQKNWVPFEHDAKVKMVCDFEPMTVITPDMQTGKIQHVSTQAIKLPWRYGTIRGSTQAYPYGKNHYITFFHSSKKTKGWFSYYYVGAMLFDNKSPFTPKKITVSPIGTMAFVNDLRDTKRSAFWLWRHRYVFPAGLAIRGDTAYVSYGLADRVNRLAKIDLKQIVNAMEPLGKDGASRS